MRIAIGSDHAGFALKEHLKAFLKGEGHDIEDVGTNDTQPVDYPDYAEKTAEPVLAGRADRAILLCGSGVGASVAANKIQGIRAGLCHDTYSAHQGVEHDDMNLLVLGARVIGEQLANELVHAFVTARFTNEERHVRRLGKVLAIEKRCGIASHPKD
jgi:RpiB/LacA/LacB family sugar-phosphate isomerase